MIRIRREEEKTREDEKEREEKRRREQREWEIEKEKEIIETHYKGLIRTLEERKGGGRGVETEGLEEQQRQRERLWEEERRQDKENIRAEY